MKYAIGKVSGVFIGQDSVTKIFGIRKKSLKPSRGTLRDCYERELECLQRLQGKPGFPILIKTVDEILAIEMENCGDTLLECWHEHDLTKFIPQAHAICDELERANIQYFTAMLNGAHNKGPDFPLNNLCIRDGELTLIDFEMANPIGHLSERLHPRLKELYGNYKAEEFREFLIETLENPRKAWERGIWRKMLEDARKTKYPKLIKENPRKVHKSMANFTTPSEKIVKEWNKYQKRYGLNDAIDRVQRMNLASVCTEDKTVIDIGCNDGYITQLVAPMVANATGVEPFVELPDDKPDNVTWIKSDFNTFLENNNQVYDVLLSLAVSIQLRDFGGLTEQQIVDSYYSLLPVGGVVVHETQKLENRPNNQAHTNAMLAAFDKKFVRIEHGQARPGGKREYYHFRKEA